MADQEMHLDVGEDLVTSPIHKEAGTASMTFDGLLQPPLLLHEDLKGGCGGQSWPAGMVLAKYLLRRRGLLEQSPSILELGAGGGLVGLSLAVAGLSGITITDQQVLLELMRQNISLNGLDGRVSAEVLDWGQQLERNPPSVLLCADLVYFEPAFPLLLTTLRALIGPDTVCFFCFKRRRRADMLFIKQLRKAFVVEDVEDDPDRPVWQRQRIFL
ncbi:MAG: hypothetical protein M1814_001731 [Vezdaea aestivalis]|nr:MAG: hypothetical protein M1814_001731 [Vezdaea aestivalis]